MSAPPRPTSLFARYSEDLERRHRAELERNETFKRQIAEFAPIFDRIPPRVKSPDPEAGGELARLRPRRPGSSSRTRPAPREAESRRRNTGDLNSKN
jgi:hypothetical protein